MSGITSLEDANRIILRQQGDLTELNALSGKYLDVINTQAREIERLLEITHDCEIMISKLNEIVQNMQSERDLMYRVDASKRRERLE